MICEDKENKILILEFGDGDILIAPGKKRDDDTPTCSFIQGECGEIGRFNHGMVAKQDTELDTRVRFVFKKVQSLDVLIEQLQIVKKSFDEK